MKKVLCFVLLFQVFSTSYTLGQEHNGLVGVWWFWPNYVLDNKAENYPGPRILPPQTPKPPLMHASDPLIFYGEEPTNRVLNFIDVQKLPKGPFTIDMWVVNHVNRPVGLLATVKRKNGPDEPSWLLGYYDKEILFTLKGKDAPFADAISHSITQRGWKKYWRHIVGVYDGKAMRLYLNGELIDQMSMDERAPYSPAEYELELASYMNNEPYMELSNLLKSLRIYDRALSAQEINANFEALKKMVETGSLYPNLFHFSAGPYLNYATENSISILWETDRPATSWIEYGKAIPYDQKVTVNSLKQGNIQEIKLTGLEPGTTYFYNIHAIAEDGREIASGPLTFGTAVKGTSPFSFAVLGDTEARPHINNRIAKLIWDERPNFLLNVGDLTDGGTAEHKFEWNYEYFAGMTQLTSRIPVFPVAGNGEDDLFWYNKYLALPAPEGYYSFRYGNAEFFMLNSNEKDEFKPGGKQYQWLEEKLKASTATWKFVAHHHAPYSSDEDDYGDSWKGQTNYGDMETREIVPLYERYGVDMVFFGHLHTYQRTMPIREGMVDSKNGVIYVQGGGGGGNLEDFAPSRAWFSAKTYRGHHYFTVNLFENTLNLKMYDSEGRLKDYLDIEK